MGFGWYKSQEALGKHEHGQDSSTEDADEKTRAIEAIFEEGEDSRTKRKMEEVLRRREVGHAKAREVMSRQRRLVQGPTSCWFTDSLNTAGWLMGWRSARKARPSTREALAEACLNIENLMLSRERSSRDEWLDWSPREANKAADGLATLAMKKKETSR